MLLQRVLYRINVYSGISPALLTSISMGSQIKANSQQELTAALKKHGIVTSSEVEQTLNRLDRKWFTTDP
jgi:hypothetical protein